MREDGERIKSMELDEYMSKRVNKKKYTLINVVLQIGLFMQNEDNFFTAEAAGIAELI
jgi:hypothetical protein